MIIATLSGAGYVISESGDMSSGDTFKIKSVEFVKSAHATQKATQISGIPIPSKKPVTKSASVLAKLAVLTANEKSLPVANKLNDKQSRLYSEIFAFQNAGNMKKADEIIPQLKSDVLMGHVLAERYMHPTAYRASYNELYNWMQKYADHPQAARIHKLALLKRPKKSSAPRSPVAQTKIYGNLGAVSKRGKSYTNTIKLTSAQAQKVRAFKKDIRRQLKRSQPTMAMNILTSDYTVKFLDNVEYDKLRAEIAAGYLFNNKLDQALTFSTQSVNRSGKKAPLAGWVKGLVQWQRGQYSSAANGFELAATSPYSSGWMVSAAGYWASRANMRSGNVKEVSKWLDLASTYPRTFYGLIATRALGHRTEFDWTAPKLTRERLKLIQNDTHGKRAIALVKAGQVSLAEAELRNFNTKKSPQHREALMAFVVESKLPAISMQLGNAYKNEKGQLYDVALYPDTSWEPKSGFKIDRALLQAIARQESRFRTNAQNPSGATGLMQLMPKTANYVSGKDIYHLASGQHELKDPSINLDIGQTYINDLLNHNAVGQDLLSLAIAYNAGPGNLSKWKSERKHIKDPLLFIETIPFHETRAFVERVLSNYWIYRMRYNQDTPTLDAVAEGKWARYAAQDNAFEQLAWR